MKVYLDFFRDQVYKVNREKLFADRQLHTQQKNEFAVMRRSYEKDKRRHTARAQKLAVSLLFARVEKIVLSHTFSTFSRLIFHSASTSSSASKSSTETSEEVLASDDLKSSKVVQVASRPRTPKRKKQSNSARSSTNSDNVVLLPRSVANQQRGRYPVQQKPSATASAPQRMVPKWHASAFGPPAAPSKTPSKNSSRNNSVAAGYSLGASYATAGSIFADDKFYHLGKGRGPIYRKKAGGSRGEYLKVGQECVDEVLKNGEKSRVYWGERERTKPKAAAKKQSQPEQQSAGRTSREFTPLPIDPFDLLNR